MGLSLDETSSGKGGTVILEYQTELQTISEGYDRHTCWVHARPGVIPGSPCLAVVTMQKARLTGDDVFYALHDMHSLDGGVTWSKPVAHPETLGRRLLENGCQEGVSDFSPGWHAASQTLLGTGHTVLYSNDELPPVPRPRSTIYSTYLPDEGKWRPWKKLELPDKIKFEGEGAGSTQRFDLENGDILLPTYFSLKETANPPYSILHKATILRCRFDGDTLRYIEHGDELTLPDNRGFVEPSLTRLKGKFYLTLRNDEAGYVSRSEDGLHFEPPRTWKFDDGSDLGNYNTQQHWVTSREALFLVYTRRGANNAHIPRHRAPLFIAQVDPERLCVLRNTERILVPERGAKLCNFGVARISDQESWVVVSEWMQTNPPNYADYTVCESRGSNNAIFLAKVKFPA